MENLKFVAFISRFKKGYKYDIIFCHLKQKKFFLAPILFNHIIS